MHAVENSSQIDIQNQVPFRGLHASDKIVSSDTSVVDQHVDGAKMLNGLFEQILNLIIFGAIRFDGKGVTAQLLTLLNSCQGVFLAALDVVDNHLLPVFCHIKSH